MNFILSCILCLFRTTVFATAVLFVVKWKYEKKRNDDLEKQRDMARDAQAAAERMAEARLQEVCKDQQLQREVLTAILKELKQSREHTDNEMIIDETNNYEYE